MKAPRLSYVFRPREQEYNRAILAARQAVCLAEMIQSGKHLFCGKRYTPTRTLLPNMAKRLYRTPWRPT